MNNRSKIWIALALAIVAIIGAYFVLDGRGDSGRDNDDQEEVGENEYLNEDYNFSFEKPEGYDLIEVTNTESARHSVVLSRADNGPVPVNGEGPTAITVDVFSDPGTDDLEKWLAENNISNFNLATADLEKTEVDGEKAVMYRWDGLYRGRSVAFVYDGSVILISGTYLEQSDPIYADFDRVVKSFNLR